MTLTLLITCVYVAVAHPELDKEVGNVLAMAFAESTMASRSSQWGKFLRFCSTLGVSGVPASTTTVCQFLCDIAKDLKHSTIQNYVSAINVLHRYMGVEIDFRQHYIIKCCLSGLKRKYGDCVIQKIPITVQEFQAMYLCMDKNSYNITCWAACMLCFRTLLRKSNVVLDQFKQMNDHFIKRKDVEFTPDGMIITIASTKTIQYNERQLKIPVKRVSSECFCAVALLEHCLNLFPAPPDACLFFKMTTQGVVKPLYYQDMLSFLKSAAKSVGLKPDSVGTHSLRRSGTLYLQSLGVPLHDIQTMGDWKSMAVLMYLATTFDRKLQIEQASADYFKNY